MYTPFRIFFKVPSRLLVDYFGSINPRLLSVAYVLKHSLVYIFLFIQLCDCKSENFKCIPEYTYYRGSFNAML